MSLDFSINLPCPSNKVYEKITDFENFSNYLPLQLQNIKKLELEQYDGIPIENNQIVTEETIVSKSVLKTEFIQKSLHTLKENELETNILEGPAKGTLINIKLNTVDNQTQIMIKIDLKLKLKFIFLKPIVKSMYKKMFTSILYRINTEIQKEIEL
tara:strand:+ start:266 stop:733 length:468 start_codon:yes stop_codon:yes gene_type:complete